MGSWGVFLSLEEMYSYLLSKRGSSVCIPLAIAPLFSEDVRLGGI